LIDDMTYLAQLDSALNEYKAEITRIIWEIPVVLLLTMLSSRKINDYLIFDPYNKQDYAMFGAVATSWNRYYPDTERPNISMNLR